MANLAILWTAPIFPSLDFWEGDFQNDFARESIYRGPPTREREQAWDEIVKWEKKENP